MGHLLCDCNFSFFFFCLVYAERFFKAGSIQLLLQTILDDFQKRQKELSLQSKAERHFNCDFCQAYSTAKLMVCGGCKKRWYCDKTCQTKDWAFHKTKCDGQKEKKSGFALKFDQGD